MGAGLLHEAPVRMDDILDLGAVQIDRAGDCENKNKGGNNQPRIEVEPEDCSVETCFGRA